MIKRKLLNFNLKKLNLLFVKCEKNLKSAQLQHFQNRFSGCYHSLFVKK